MTERVVVIGAGGFGREALDVAGAAGLEIAGVVDSAPSGANLELLEAMGHRYLGTVDSWLASRPPERYLIGVGDVHARARLDAAATAVGLMPATVVHPWAGIGSLAVLGPGSVVCAGAQLATNVRLGRHVHVNPNATIGHDAVLHDHVSVNPGAIVSGAVRIGCRTLLGAGAVVLQGLVVAEDVVVGAAACVTANVTARRTVKGVPAR